MNAPTEKHLMAEFEEFKELLRHSGPPDPSGETPPAEAAAQARPDFNETLRQVEGADPKTARRPRKASTPKAAPPRDKDKAAADDGKGSRRPLYLAAALAILVIGAIAAAATLWSEPADSPETTETESPSSSTAAESLETPDAAARDAVLDPAAPAIDPLAAPPAAETQAEPLAPAEAAPTQPARAPVTLPVETRPAAALPEGALSAPLGVSATPPVTAQPLTAQPIAAPPAPEPVTTAPPAAIAAPKAPPRAPTAAPKPAAKAHDHNKTTQAPKPAKPKPAEPSAKVAPAPPAQIPVAAEPPAPPPPAAPSEQPSFVQRAVDSVTGAVGDLGRMATGVLPP